MASVEKRIRGGKVTWLARWREPGGKQCKESFRRKTDAERRLIEVSASLLSGTYVDANAGKITVGEYAPGWLSSRVHLKPKTRAGYMSLLKTRVLPQWGTVPLSRITYGGVSAWVSQMVAEGLSASRTRHAYHLLSGLLDDAVKDSRLVRNPASGVDLPRLVLQPRRYLTHGQVTELADASGEYRALVLVLAYCGIRWGEAAALKVGRVDPLRGRLDIVEAVTDVNGRMVFGSPKSHQHRSVPVPKFLRDELAAVMAGKGPGELVFTSPAGAVLRVQNFRRRSFDRATSSVGLDGLVPHELRHTAASLAIASGASVKAVQKMLGHASAALTLDRYGHLFGDELDTVAERLDAARAQAAVPRACPDASVIEMAERRIAR